MARKLRFFLFMSISTFVIATTGFTDPRYPNDLASIRDAEIVNTLRGASDEAMHVMCSTFPSVCRALTTLRNIADGKANAELPDCILVYERKVETFVDVIDACGVHKELPRPDKSTESKWAKFIDERRRAIAESQMP